MASHKEAPSDVGSLASEFEGSALEVPNDEIFYLNINFSTNF